MKFINPLDKDFQKYVYEKYPNGLTRFGWGSLPTNETVRNVFREVNEICKPKRVVEVGMFVGHSTCMMFDHFDQLEKLYSFDPNMVSYEAALILRDTLGDRFSFLNMPFASNHILDIDEDVNFIYIDGSHQPKAVMHDVQHALKFPNVEYILMDNLEHKGVQDALKVLDMYHPKYEQKYWLYQAVHRNRMKPGILGLFKI